MRRKGFTLIELLVVIAIIGLLVSILVPSINQAQKMAKRATCAANLSGIGKALVMYQTANKDRYPYISGGEARGGNNQKLDMIFDSVAVYNVSDVNEDNNGSSAIFYLDGEWTETVNLNMVENLNLLFKEDYINSWKNFRCPQASSEIMDRSDVDDEPEYGFIDSNGKAYVDYGYHLGYYSIQGRKLNAARLYSNTPGNMVIVGDQCGEDENGEVIVSNFDDPTNGGRGFNHEDDGLNLLRADGAVNWSQSVFGGADKNNVFTADMDGYGEVDPTKDSSSDYTVAAQVETPSWLEGNDIDTVLIRIEIEN